MSLRLWRTLPDGFLRMSYRRWEKLGPDVQALIVELAQAQNFHCAHCSKTHGLVIEHDHEPEEGPGGQNCYTIYNVRGLACSRCNFHLSLYERGERGEETGWDHVFCILSEPDYYRYIESYESRVRPLLEQLREGRMGSLNHWRRRLMVDEFDDWKEWGGAYPWQWGFGEIKDKRQGPIRNATQFFVTLAACVKFVADEIERDPNYEPPDEFVTLVVKLRPVLDEIRAKIPGMAGGRP
jgi:hypothetical protein